MNKNQADKQYLDEVNPCPHGHGNTPTYRYKRNGECVECRRAKNRSISAEKAAVYNKTAKDRKNIQTPSPAQLLRRVLNDQLDWHLAQPDQKLHQVQARIIADALAYKQGDIWEHSI